MLAALLSAALIAAEAQAQPQGGGRGRGGRGGGPMGGGPMMLMGLVQNPDVQKELEVVDDQKTKLTDLASQERTAMGGMRDLSQEDRQAKVKQLQDDFQKKLADILLPKQMDRLKQIQLQLEGPRALANPDVVKALNLTDEQKEKIKTITDEAQAKNQEATQGLRGTERRAKMQDLNKDLTDKLLAVLTPDQAAQFDKLKGAKVNIDMSTLMRGPGRGGPNGPGGPGGPNGSGGPGGEPGAGG